MSNWQTQNPQPWDNNYGNQYGGYSKKNGNVENQYKNNYYNQASSKKNPLQHQYSNPKASKGHGQQNGYPGGNNATQNQRGYQQGFMGLGGKGQGHSPQQYKTNDDVRPLTERPQQPFQQFGQNGDKNRYNSNPHLNGNQGGYNGNLGGNDQGYSRRDKNRAKSMRKRGKSGKYDDPYGRNQANNYTSPNPNRGGGGNNYMNTFNGIQNSPVGGRRPPGVPNSSMRETMEPRYNNQRRDEGGARRFLSPQPRRDQRPDASNTKSTRDIQRPFWKSPNGNGRAKSRKMNLTLKDIQKQEELANQRPNFGGFEPSTNDSARGIRNEDGKRESKWLF